MTDLVKDKVNPLRNEARTTREMAILNHDLDSIEEAATLLQQAIGLLRPHLPDRNQIPSTIEKTYAQKLYQCLGSLGGTYRDAAELNADPDQQQEYWDLSIQYYDEGYQIEAGMDPRYPDFGFVDSYNLLQRLVVRILREPDCLTHEDRDLGTGLNVPRELEMAEREIRTQLDEASDDSQHNDHNSGHQGSRAGDPWAMADLAQLMIFCGEAQADAWRHFGEKTRSKEAYETNHRAFSALVTSGEKTQPPPSWLPAARDTVRWLADKLNTIYGIEV